jgi:transposase InsO family protein
MNLHSQARSCPASRALLVSRVRKSGWKVKEAAMAAGVSERTAYKWLARHKAQGETGLRDRSSRPHRMPGKLAEGWVKVVLELREGRKTAAQIAKVLKLPRSTVARVLQRHGLSRLRSLEPVQPVRRYEWAHPGDMLHLDVKKLGRIKGIGHRITGDRTKSKRQRGIGWDFVHVCIDDASRMAYVEVLNDEKKETCTAFLRRAVAWFVRQGIRVRRVLTDNGNGYRSLPFRHACAKLRIKHRRTRPYTPRTNGKAERFIQTLLRECAYAIPFTSSLQRQVALRGWIQHYNRRRTHSAIGTTPYRRMRQAA